MSDRLGERLRRAEPPDAEGARRRARAAVLAAAPPPSPRRRRRIGLGVALALAAVAVALTPPGEAVGEWLRRAADPPPPPAEAPATPPRPADVLPGGGRVLAREPGGVVVVRRDGGRERLGRWSGAAWSPRGLFVVAWRGPELAALEPDGTVRWRLRAPGSIRGARWSPDGFRIAYLTGAAELRVVAGDGTGDRRLGNARPVAPAWRPGEPRTLASVRRGGRVEVRDVDTGTLRWRSRRLLSRRTRALSWSPDGRRLLAVAPRGLRVLDLRRERVVRLSAPPGARVTGAAFAPRGRALAVVTRGGGRSALAVRGRELFSTRGRLSAPVWSPDGAWVVAGWRGAGQWVAVRAKGAPRLAAVERAGAPLGWCCARR